MKMQKRLWMLSWKSNMKTKEVPFRIYLPATKCDDEGKPIDHEYVGTLLIKVAGEHSFVSLESHLEINMQKINFINKRIAYYENLKVQLQKEVKLQNNGTAKKHNN